MTNEARRQGETDFVSDAPVSAAGVYLIAASGTGGHIFPALYIAQAIKNADPLATVEFIGSGRPLEEKLIDSAGYTRHVIGVSGVRQSGIGGLLRFVRSVPAAANQIRQLIRTKKVRAVIGVGGYVSVVPVLVAKICRVPTWIHEAELRPGTANWFLSLFAKRMSLAFEDAKAPFWAKIEHTGHPVRPEISAVDRTTIPVDAPKRILVIGGSQGARALDVSMPTALGLLETLGVQVCHQCRPENVDEVSKAYSEKKITARVLPFIEDMAAAYSWSDIIVSRAGAGSIMEIATVNRPAILVPYPHQQGTHQTDNAKTLSTRGKALLVEEGADFEKRLQSSLEELLDPAKYRAMKELPGDGRNVDAADRIAKGIVGLGAQVKV